MNARHTIVNQMLALAGLAFSESKEINHPLYPTANTIIDNQNKMLQCGNNGKGWWWNTDTMELQSDANGYISVPSDILHVDVFYPKEHCDCVRRGSYLFDRNRQTFIFPEGTSVKAKVTLLIDIEDTPVVFKNALTHACLAEFAGGTINEPSAFQRETALTQQAIHDLRQDNAEQSRPNIIDNTALGRMAYTRSWRYVR